MYKCFIQPIILYAAPVWGTRAKTHLQSIQAIQNKAAKIITGAHISTALLHVVLDIRYLENELKIATGKLFDQLKKNENQLIANLGKYTIQNYFKSF